MIEKDMRKVFSIADEKETRLWNRYMSNTFEPLNKPDSTIQDAGLYQGQVRTLCLFSSTWNGHNCHRLNTSTGLFSWSQPKKNFIWQKSTQSCPKMACFVDNYYSWAQWNILWFQSPLSGSFSLLMLSASQPFRPQQNGASENPYFSLNLNRLPWPAEGSLNNIRATF